jgi:FkbM family methyltransferase
MIRQIKSVLKKSMSAGMQAIGKTGIGKIAFKGMLSSAMNQTAETSHNGLQFRFAVPNTLCDWRIKTFASKEPETLEWIDGLSKDAILWDIGANIGLYSVYAAKKSNCRVYAFEPSVFNLELLARNIYVNQLTDRVCIVPLALSDEMSISNMRMTSTEWGGALSSFGKEFGWDGKSIKQTFDYRMVGVSMEDAVQKLNIPLPDYIKMDVDGLEHFILKGGASVLKHIREIIIEVNDDFVEQAEQCHKLLQEAGLTLREKKHSDIIAASTAGFANSYNQIWTRN